jgi:hypothetical protein
MNRKELIISDEYIEVNIRSGLKVSEMRAFVKRYRDELLDLPENKGSETEAMLEISRNGFGDQIQKEKGCRSCRFINFDGREPCNTCGDGDYVNWQPLPAVPQERGDVK